MAGSVLDIPGYADAIARERVIREAAFLPLTETVGGFELVPMTLRQFLTLSLMRSPLLTGATPAPADLAAFLWLLNPQYKPAGGLRRWLMVRRLRRCVPPPAPLWTSQRISARYDRRVKLAFFRAAKLTEALRAYVAETLQDLQPANTPAGIVQTEHYSDAVAICAALAREYHGWREADILPMPMKRVLQYLKEIRVYNGSKLPLINPSDRVKADWLAQVNPRRN